MPQIEKEYENIVILSKFDSAGNLIDTMLIDRFKLSGVQGTINPAGHIISDLGEVKYLYYPVLLPGPPLRNILYRLESKSLVPEIKIDFGKDAETDADGLRQLYVRSMFRTDRFLFVGYIHNRIRKTLCYDFSERVIYNSEDGIKDDIINGGKLELKPLDLASGELFFSVEAVNIKERPAGIDVSSNPIIYFINLK